MAGKYAPLADYLKGQSESPHTMRFDEIARLISGGLPDSAHERRQWWDNDRALNSRHMQSKHGWLAAGWEVESVDLNEQAVTFRK